MSQFIQHSFKTEPAHHLSHPIISISHLDPAARSLNVGSPIQLNLDSRFLVPIDNPRQLHWEQNCEMPSDEDVSSDMHGGRRRDR
ncbi:uncharacterized protein STEHIDRAFT_161589 [Stereum hirsutum FP-91666 SS1]|uniref:uncharacterized protein n=1 Tax=Stereum hirsutum (strain FP-91666) TaxID=721885 RepID=UPI000444A461|nr:uncharacterized protein STEHIDRAFT_161589 [Stereum hirsutum FP-91666 SS1]EIM81396.1 hypothetical protein STEHIDRAFT_161589 [Stereum hirsutum FP-91666 SS1]